MFAVVLMVAAIPVGLGLGYLLLSAKWFPEFTEWVVNKIVK